MPQDNRPYYKTTITIYRSDDVFERDDLYYISEHIERHFSNDSNVMVWVNKNSEPCKIEDMPKGIRGEMRNFDRGYWKELRECSRYDWDAGFKDLVPQGFTFKDWELTGFTESIPEILEYMQRKEEFFANKGEESENASN